jgi:hypothetical protein
MPADAAGRYPPQSDYLTYTNSLIVNKTVLVPTYGLPGDSAALQLYRNVMPGYRVMGFDCNAIIGQLGAIHCITKEVGVREPVRIAHARLWEAADTSQFYPIEARINVRSGVDSAFVWWRADTSLPFTRHAMTDSSGVFVAHIPSQSLGTHIAYYIDVLSHSHRRVTKPLTGAAGAFVFEVVASLPSGVRNDSRSNEFTLKQNYPNPFNPSTAIQFSVAKKGMVTLTVYDILGREVTTLLREEKDAGTYKVQFDASRFASGTYMYRIVAGDYVDVKKMLLLK